MRGHDPFRKVLVMMYSRIISLVVVGLGLLVALSQIGAGAQAAPGGGLAPSARPNDQAPYHIAIQGRIQPPATLSFSTAVNVTFRLYDAPVGGNLLFTESAVIQPAADGQFTYELGTNASIGQNVITALASPVYLGITVQGNPEQPRHVLPAAPYAMSLAPGAQIVTNQDTYAFSIADTSQHGWAFVSQGYTAIAGAGNIQPYSVGVGGLSDSPNGIGTGGIGDGHNGVGVLGDACWNNPCDGSSLGGYFKNYDHSASAVAIQLIGVGQATGGFVTGGGYSLMVRYHGSGPLHAGDVLALDGNNGTFNGGPILGTVKADASNADGAIGVAQHRYIAYPATAPQPNAPASLATSIAGEPRTQVDGKSTTFQPGDLVEVVVVGQVQMKISGSVKVGARVGLDDAGSVVVAPKGSSNSIGKVASKPDAQGIVTVFVNFK